MLLLNIQSGVKVVCSVCWGTVSKASGCGSLRRTSKLKTLANIGGPFMPRSSKRRRAQGHEQGCPSVPEAVSSLFLFFLLFSHFVSVSFEFLSRPLLPTHVLFAVLRSSSSSRPFLEPSVSFLSLRFPPLHPFLFAPILCDPSSCFHCRTFVSFSVLSCCVRPFAFLSFYGLSLPCLSFASVLARPFLPFAFLFRSVSFVSVHFPHRRDRERQNRWARNVRVGTRCVQARSKDRARQRQKGREGRGKDASRGAGRGRSKERLR